MASAGGDNGDPEFQIAPMIDVLLVLLIFFMSITTSQVAQVDKAISPPVAPDAKDPERDLKNEAIVNVDWDAPNNRSRLSLGTTLCDPANQLTEFLTPMRERNPKMKLVIRADANTPAIEIQKVIEYTAAAGIDDISLAGVNRAK